MDFEACLQRMRDEILPLVQQPTFPPRLPEDILEGSLDLILYRNLCYALEFCFGQLPVSVVSHSQLEELSLFARTQVIPAYLAFFNAHLLLPGEAADASAGEKCSLFFVRQENNSSWAKLIWNRIKQVYESVKNSNSSSSNSHGLGVQMPGDLLDALARLMNMFLPRDIRMFEAIGFDLRNDDPHILEEILQGGLINRTDPLAAKNAFYILNRIVSFSQMKGDGFAGANLRAWEQFVVSYAAVQESQVHLVQPLLPVLGMILKKSSSNDSSSSSSINDGGINNNNNNNNNNIINTTTNNINTNNNGQLSLGWWRVLIIKGLCNDSIPIRRVILHSVLGVDARDTPALCCPDGLDFCLDELLRLGVDPNSSFFVAPQAVSGGPGGELIDLGEMLACFFAHLIEAYAAVSPGHGRAIVNELLAAVEENLRVPVGLIYVLKAFKAASTAFPALGNASLQCMSRLATLPSLHNQRARLLVKWQLCELLMAFADASAISFDQLCCTVNDLILESVTLLTLGAESENFTKMAQWLNECFGTEFLRENMLIALQQFFTAADVELQSLQSFPNSTSPALLDVRGMKNRAQILASMCIFSLGSPDGRFVAYSRMIFEQLALVTVLDGDGSDGAGSIPAFVMFLALNETVQAVLKGRNDLITQLGTSNKIFEWLAFLDEKLFTVRQVDLTACQVLLEALALLINRASDNDERQLMQFLDMLSFRLAGFIDEKALKQRQQRCPTEPTKDDSNEGKGGDDEGEGEATADDTVGFTGLLSVFSAMTALSSVLHKLAALGHVRLRLLSAEQVQRVIRFKLERPAGLTEEQWDLWPTFVTQFTEAKWKCIEAMALTMCASGSGIGIGNDPSGDSAAATFLVSGNSSSSSLSLLGILASCIQALEVSKYGGTLAILKCTGTLVDLILDGSNEEVDPAFYALFARESEIMMAVLKGQAETQKWFDLYADAFIKVAFRTSVLCASCRQPSGVQQLVEVLHELFDFFCDTIGPKRRGILALVSAKLGEFFLSNQEFGLVALRDHWRSQLLRLLLYGPVRQSVDESVAARIRHEHVPDSDYQVRVHAITVLNHLRDDCLLKDLLMDLIGRQEAMCAATTRRKMFPGDGNHRLKLRAWAAILLMIGILVKSDSFDLATGKDLVDALWRFIGEETMDSTRVFMEWSLGLIYLKFPEELIFPDLIARRMSGFEGFSCQVVSVLSVALLLGKGLDHVAPELARSRFFPQMIHHVLPLLAHNNHFVRMRAIHAFSVLYRPSAEGNNNNNNNVLGYSLLAGYIGGTDHCKKFIQKCQDDLVTAPDGLHPLDDVNLDYIFGKLMTNGGVDGEAIEYYAFMNYHEAQGSVPFVRAAAETATAADQSETAPAELCKSVVRSGTASAEPIDFDGLFRDFQQKIDIYSPFAAEQDSATAAAAATKLDTEIVVIASLLEKLPNLAGLARSCEIFGVKRLFVPAGVDLTCPDFVNVAMTADRWLDLKPLATESVVSEVDRLKAEGFKIVALEQTSNSVPLQNYAFSRKTCLILGNERTGVPADILHCVDDCVEIPQFGRVRSLNVHVSGSIAIWKAREQDLQ